MSNSLEDNSEQNKRVSPNRYSNIMSFATSYLPIWLKYIPYCKMVNKTRLWEILISQDGIRCIFVAVSKHQHTHWNP